MSDVLQPRAVVDTTESQRAVAAAEDGVRLAGGAEGDAFARAQQLDAAQFALQQASGTHHVLSQQAQEAAYFNTQVLPQADLNRDGMTTQAELAEQQRRETMAPLATASALIGAMMVAEAVPAVAAAVTEGPATGFNAMSAAPMTMEAAAPALEAPAIAAGPTAGFASLAAPGMGEVIALGAAARFIAPEPANAPAVEPVVEPVPVAQAAGDEMAVAAPVRRPSVAAPMPMMAPPAPSWAKEKS